MDKSKQETRKRVIRLAQAKKRGRGPTVVCLAQAGYLRKLRPGVYRPTDREVWMNQDLLDACAAVPNGVTDLKGALGDTEAPFLPKLRRLPGSHPKPVPNWCT